MSYARGAKPITVIAMAFPYQVELRDLWGNPDLPLFDLDRAARWYAEDKAWCRTAGRARDHSAPRWAFAEFAAAEAFHARFGGRLVDAGDGYPESLRTRSAPRIRDILAERAAAPQSEPGA
ncbi:hypothetical protein [Enterovirga rhinocerotis]|uniref:Uncharacterized protein n=1 Tax=Enterovirga rhinocerotis TaxID=1339210 RepID=A0A4R7C4R8_9HYPH|nr:hypothetical protein [Enterovirga rhinocerotis]TDR93514.1 hypothetical protein EV668_0777 [Enterovirga rhinocerotis]